MVGNTAGLQQKSTKEWLLEARTASSNKKERLIGLGVEQDKLLNLEIGAAGDLLMGGMKGMVDITKNATKTVGGGLMDINKNM